MCRAARCGTRWRRARATPTHAVQPRAHVPALFSLVGRALARRLSLPHALTAPLPLPSSHACQAAGHVIDERAWHACAHGRVHYERHLTTDPALRAMLASVPLPLYVFTNADDAHAEACLKALGVRDLFKARNAARSAKHTRIRIITTRHTQRPYPHVSFPFPVLCAAVSGRDHVRDHAALRAGCWPARVARAVQACC
jgi:hypothetical protein